MIKILILVFILIFNIQSWTKADDIRDFEIEGMSVGDSALNFVDKITLDSKNSYMWEDKKYGSYAAESNGNDIYDYWQIFYLDNDQKYIIQYISGFNYITDLEECNKTKKNIVFEIKNLIPDSDFTDFGKIPHPGDSTGKSQAYKVQFKLKDKSEIMVTCTVFSKKYKETWSLGNTLSVSAHSKKFSNYLLNEAY
tara:strand:+ start:1421 stop:2005 length:585 start_codon:yes stop_codon:yes gene_type:complete